MAIARRRQTQRGQNQQLPRCIGQMIVTAQGMGDTRIGIVYRIAKEERRTAVSPPHNKVAQFTGRHRTRTVHQVVKLHHLP